MPRSDQSHGRTRQARFGGTDRNPGTAERAVRREYSSRSGKSSYSDVQSREPFSDRFRRVGWYIRPHDLQPTSIWQAALDVETGGMNGTKAPPFTQLEDIKIRTLSIGRAENGQGEEGTVAAGVEKRDPVHGCRCRRLYCSE